MTIQVSSASTRPQRLADVTSATYAIGREEIRRPGTTNLPELLRTVPCVQVSRIDASLRAVRIRGLSNRYSGKFRVLQDKRNLYNPLLSGTYWEAQDVLLEGVERIEGIRGSGGTLWGANAVNGVINTMTRQAKVTRGTHAGALESGVAIRQVGHRNEDGNCRVYAKVNHHNALENAGGTPAPDKWQQKRAGFQADLAPHGQDSLSVQGDVYDGKSDQRVLIVSRQTFASAMVPDTAKLPGGNLLLRWNRKTDKEKSWQFQASIDHARQGDAVQRQEIGRFATQPINFSNLMLGNSYGAKFATNWQAAPTWRLHGSHSFLKMALRARASSMGTVGFGAEGASPKNMAQPHSLYNLAHNLELDVNLYFTAGLYFQDLEAVTRIEKSASLDLRLGWGPTPELEISLIGRNLLRQSVQTYMPDDMLASRNPRSLLAQIRRKY